MFDPFKQAKLQNSYQSVNYPTTKDPRVSLRQHDELKRLSGSGKITGESTAPIDTQLQAKKAQYISDNNLRPGDSKWMKVMFAKPHITGENPFN